MARDGLDRLRLVSWKLVCSYVYSVQQSLTVIVCLVKRLNVGG